MGWKLKHYNELSVDELYEILYLRSEVFIVEQTCIYMDVDGKDKASYHLFLEDEGKVLAYLRIIPRGISYDEMSIGRVLTKMSIRHQGYGKELMTRALDFIKNELKEKEVRISAQAHLSDFYGSFGFKRVSDVYLEDDIPHVEMLYRE